MQRHAKRRLTPEQAFAKVLREVRKERGISQEELGFESGYHRTYIGMLERGLMNPTLRTILSVASALEVPAGELVQRVEAVLGKGWKREREGTG
jgi:transcriptional regulator with XRE-family HTH domain